MKTIRFTFSISLIACLAAIAGCKADPSADPAEERSGQVPRGVFYLGVAPLSAGSRAGEPAATERYRQSFGGLTVVIDGTQADRPLHITTFPEGAATGPYRPPVPAGTSLKPSVPSSCFSYRRVTDAERDLSAASTKVASHGCEARVALFHPEAAPQGAWVPVSSGNPSSVSHAGWAKPETERWIWLACPCGQFEALIQKLK